MYGKSMSCVVLVWLVVARIRGLSQVLPRLPVSRLGWAGLGWAGLVWKCGKKLANDGGDTAH